MKHLYENYPPSFNTEEFKSLTTFVKRKKYCDLHFPEQAYICSGSSRYVYRIDTDKVLKLAKNKKGLLQNETEWVLFNDAYAPGGLAPIYDGDDENYAWIEMAYAEKLTEKKFQKITGFSSNNFFSVIKAEFSYLHRHDALDMQRSEEVKESPLYNNIWEFIVNFSMPIGDLLKLSSYGIINGEIYLIDYGLTDEILRGYY
jgi:hypothetical protein